MDRFSVIEIDNVPAAAVESPEATLSRLIAEEVGPTAALAVPPLTVQGYAAVPAVDFETRQETLRRHCYDIGIDIPRTILPEGTALYSSGEDRLRADRAAWAKLPFAKDAIPTVRAALTAEDRQDYRVNVSALRLHDRTGRLTTGKGEAGYSPHAFRQLCAQIPDLSSGTAPRGMASALLHLNGSERAAVVNARIPAAQSTVTLRTKLSHNGRRIVRAALSERYASVSDVDVADAIAHGLSADLDRARLDYLSGESRSMFEVFWPSEIPVRTFKVGDIHRAVVQVRNSETGEGCIEVVPGIVRALCANLTLAFGAGVKVAIRHIGDVRRVNGQMRAAIRQAIAQIEPLVFSIQEAAQTALPEGTTVSAMLERIGKRFNVADDRVTAWSDTFQRSYADSPTLWGVTSAITEAAQSLPWWQAQAAEETIAAQLVAVKWQAVR